MFLIQINWEKYVYNHVTYIGKIKKLYLCHQTLENTPINMHYFEFKFGF